MSSDGLHFEMDKAPIIFPGPSLTDLDGCEDPTVLVSEGRLRVWYTGWNQQQETGRLLLARGPDVARLAKAGIALESHPPFANPKELSVIQTPSGWRMLFEYADNGASLTGRATAGDPDGPWSEVSQLALKPRPDSWDDWHLSPGPLIESTGDRSILFYNGATQDAHWRIGWAELDKDLFKVVDRCVDPLIVPTEIGGAATDIAFATSAFAVDETVWLYLSQSDQDLRRAVLKRVGGKRLGEARHEGGEFFRVIGARSEVDVHPVKRVVAVRARVGNLIHQRPRALWERIGNRGGEHVLLVGEQDRGSLVEDALIGRAGEADLHGTIEHIIRKGYDRRHGGARRAATGGRRAHPATRMG